MAAVLISDAVLITDVNGTYTEQGTSNGQPYFKHDTNNYWIMYYDDTGGDFGSDIWVLSSANPAGTGLFQIYNTGSDTANPWDDTSWGSGPFGPGDTVTVAEGDDNSSSSTEVSETSSSSGGGSSSRGLFSGGDTGSKSDVIDYINISTSGTATDFGNLSAAKEDVASTASTTRAVMAGGFNGSSNLDVIDYVTIASTGNTTDFGDLSVARRRACGSGSETIGIFAGGNDGSLDDTIDYVTIASTGNATDFGDLTVAREVADAGCSSTTISVFAGGLDEGGFSSYDTIDYVTIASTGNATDFGNLSVQRGAIAAASSNTRGVFAGGSSDSVTPSNVIDYITIASTGNATDFGDLAIANKQRGGTSNGIAGVFGGGYRSDDYTTNIERITITNAANATDFGDLSVARFRLSATSDAHGGIETISDDESSSSSSSSTEASETSSSSTLSSSSSSTSLSSSSSSSSSTVASETSSSSTLSSSSSSSSSSTEASETSSSSQSIEDLVVLTKISETDKTVIYRLTATLGDGEVNEEIDANDLDGAGDSPVLAIAETTWNVSTGSLVLKWQGASANTTAAILSTSGDFDLTSKGFLLKNNATNPTGKLLLTTQNTSFGTNVTAHIVLRKVSGFTS